MEKRRLKISKSLIKAQFLAFVAIVLAAIVVHLVVIKIPSSPYAKVYNFQMLNHNNPQVATTEYYQDQSVIANKEDWMIFTPISFLVGGIVFGLIISPLRKPLAAAKAALGTAIGFSLLILILSFAGNYFETLIVQAGAYSTAPAAPDFRYYAMGVLQTAYWSVFFVASGFLGGLLRRSNSQRLPQSSSPTGTLTAAK